MSPDGAGRDRMVTTQAGRRRIEVWAPSFFIFVCVAPLRRMPFARYFEPAFVLPNELRWRRCRYCDSCCFEWLKEFEYS